MVLAGGGGKQYAFREPRWGLGRTAVTGILPHASCFDCKQWRSAYVTGPFFRFSLFVFPIRFLSCSASDCFVLLQCVCFLLSIFSLRLKANDLSCLSIV